MRIYLRTQNLCPQRRTVHLAQFTPFLFALPFSKHNMPLVSAIWSAFEESRRNLCLEAASDDDSDANDDESADEGERRRARYERHDTRMRELQLSSSKACFAELLRLKPNVMADAPPDMVHTRHTQARIHTTRTHTAAEGHLPFVRYNVASVTGSGRCATRCIFFHPPLAPHNARPNTYFS